MADINIGKAPKNYAVLPFYAGGAFFLICIALALLWVVPELNGHYAAPHIVALVHMFTVGWASMIMMGATYQLLPVICEHDLFSSRLSLFSFCCVFVGALLLISSFWWFHPGWWMLSGGTLIWIASVAYLINVVGTGGRCDRHHIRKCFMVFAGSWFVFTTTLGWWTALQFVHPVSHVPIPTWLKIHAHVGMAGWFLQLISGVSTQLIPMFLLGKSKKSYLLNWAFVLQNIGLLSFVVLSWLIGIHAWIWISVALVVAGIVFHLAYLYDAYQHRVRKPLDLQMKHSLLSFLFLSLAILSIPVVYAFDHRWSIIYGMLLLMGWVSSLILGQTFKTLPFIVWNDRYKQWNGKFKVPLPRQLYSERKLQWQFRLYLASWLLLFAGIMLQNRILDYAGSLCWLGMSVCYGWNVIQILFHRVQIPEHAGTVHTRSTLQRENAGH
ncbi:MAG: hypothetical protein IRZ01_08635 [Thermoflavifilum aggregans]|nr:hypothetical protein [Thermoflavifilum aggregans]